MLIRVLKTIRVHVINKQNKKKDLICQDTLIP